MECFMFIGNSKYEVITSMDGFKFQSTLIIRDTTSEDFGYYGCAVSNPLGSGESSIYLEKQGKNVHYHAFALFAICY